LNDSEFTTISNLPVIKSLISVGAILVLNQEPAELKNNVEALKGDNASLVAKVTELEASLSQKDEEIRTLQTHISQMVEPEEAERIKEEAVAEIKAQAVAELQEKEDRIQELTSALAEAEAKRTTRKSNKASTEEVDE